MFSKQHLSQLLFWNRNNFQSGLFCKIWLYEKGQKDSCTTLENFSVFVRIKKIAPMHKSWCPHNLMQIFTCIVTFINLDQKMSLFQSLAIKWQKGNSNSRKCIQPHLLPALVQYIFSGGEPQFISGIWYIFISCGQQYIFSNIFTSLVKIDIFPSHFWKPFLRLGHEGKLYL